MKDEFDADTKIVCFLTNNLGDILYVEPVLRRLAEDYVVEIKGKPHCLDVLKNHPLIKASVVDDLGHDINFNMCYEGMWKDSYLKNRKTPHITQCYLTHCIDLNFLSSNCEINRRPKIYLSEHEKEYAKKILPSPSKWIVIDMGQYDPLPQFPNYMRTNFKIKEWNVLFEALRFVGYRILAVSKRWCNDDLQPDIDLRANTNLRQLFAIIDRAEFFIGIETGTLAVATAFDKPGVFIASVSPDSALLLPDSKLKTVRSFRELHGITYHHCLVHPHNQIEQQKMFELLKEATTATMPGDEILNVFSEM